MRHKIPGLRWWLGGIVMFGSIIAFRHIWLWLPEHRYSQLISHTDLVTALETGQSQQVTRLADKYQYDYQIFASGRLQQQRGAGWPLPHFIPKPTSAQGVLPTSLADQLHATQPYEFNNRLHRYIFFATTSGPHTYVIYQRVF